MQNELLMKEFQSLEPVTEKVNLPRAVTVHIMFRMSQSEDRDEYREVFGVSKGLKR